MIESISDLYIVMRLFWSDPQDRWDSTLIMFILDVQVDFSFFMWGFHESFWLNVSPRM